MSDSCLLVARLRRRQQPASDLFRPQGERFAPRRRVIAAAGVAGRVRDESCVCFVHPWLRSTGRSGREPHSAHEPSYRPFGLLPTDSNARVRIAAVTPEPQLVITGLSRSTPAALKAASMRSRDT